MTPGVLVDPRNLFLERAGHEVEGHRRLDDLGVVDAADRFGVGALDESGAQHGTNLTRNGDAASPGARPLSLLGLAPLAQSAEHFHGKEGVYGSSP